MRQKEQTRAAGRVLYSSFFFSLKLLSFRECVKGIRGQKETTKEGAAEAGRDTEGEKYQKWSRWEGNRGLWLKENPGVHFPFLYFILV